MMIKMDVLSFRLRDYFFSFNVTHVKEVVHMADLLKPPGTPSFIEGFLNVESTAVPVLSLSRLLFSSPPEKQIYTPLIILKPSTTSANPWAALVDTVLGINTIPQEKLLPVKEKLIFTNCVTAVSEVNQQNIYLLDPGKILLEQEEKQVLEFREMTQKRINNAQTKKRKQKKHD